jgi:hypothetical protein
MKLTYLTISISFGYYYIGARMFHHIQSISTTTWQKDFLLHPEGDNRFDSSLIIKI